MTVAFLLLKGLSTLPTSWRGGRQRGTMRLRGRTPRTARVTTVIIGRKVYVICSIRIVTFFVVVRGRCSRRTGQGSRYPGMWICSSNYGCLILLNPAAPTTSCSLVGSVHFQCHATANIVRARQTTAINTRAAPKLISKLYWFLVVGLPPLRRLLVVDIPRSLVSAVSSKQENENASWASSP